MKASLATAASVVGVLLSATAAYALNSRVLTPAPPKPPALVSAPQQSTTPAGSATAASADVEETGLPTQEPAVSKYDLGEAGTISLRQTPTGVEVVSVDSTWTFTSTTSQNGVALRFQKLEKGFSFNAILVDGRISASIQNLTPVPVVVQPSPRRDGTQANPGKDITHDRENREEGAGEDERDLEDSDGQEHSNDHDAELEDD